MELVVKVAVVLVSLAAVIVTLLLPFAVTLSSHGLAVPFVHPRGQLPPPANQSDVNTAQRPFGDTFPTMFCVSKYQLVPLPKL